MTIIHEALGSITSISKNKIRNIISKIGLGVVSHAHNLRNRETEAGEFL